MNMHWLKFGVWRVKDYCSLNEFERKQDPKESENMECGKKETIIDA